MRRFHIVSTHSALFPPPPPSSSSWEPSVALHWTMSTHDSTLVAPNIAPTRDDAVVAGDVDDVAVVVDAGCCYCCRWRRYRRRRRLHLLQNRTQ